MPTLETKVQPEQLLKDLRRLWSDLGKQDENGVLRACAMTLIVAVHDDAEHALQVSETIAALMHEHPSRAIVIRVRPVEGDLLEARVLAQCWMPFGGRQQICCEEIEITCSPSSVIDLPSVIHGLVVPDLPVVLYCPDPDLCQSRQFAALVPLCDKLIIDSGLGCGLATIDYLNKLPATVRGADLAWGRLTPWRESIARMFEDPARIRAARKLENIQISYVGAPEPVDASYMAAWFRHVLGSAVPISMDARSGPAYAALARLELRGPHLQGTVELVDSNAVELRVGEIHQKILFPELSDFEILRRELAIVGRDPIFEAVLTLAKPDAR